jgi:hypothetical protein
LIIPKNKLFLPLRSLFSKSLQVFSQKMPCLPCYALFRAYLKARAQNVAAGAKHNSNVALGMAGMFQHLCRQRTDTEESGVGGGGRMDAAAPNRNKIGVEKTRLFIH